jgi:hypothetical protein
MAAVPPLAAQSAVAAYAARSRNRRRCRGPSSGRRQPERRERLAASEAPAAGRCRQAGIRLERAAAGNSRAGADRCLQREFISCAASGRVARRIAGHPRGLPAPVCAIGRSSAQGASPLYNDAMQMAIQGHDATTIAHHCGIARAEADLVVALARNRHEGSLEAETGVADGGFDSKAGPGAGPRAAARAWHGPSGDQASRSQAPLHWRMGAAG